jgi:hypothetical protein
MPTPTGALLESARNHLLANGWTQHRYTRTDTGEICILRALFLASRDLTWPAHPVYRGVSECDALLRDLVGGQNLSAWNDRQERTPEDVLSLLDAAIALANGQQ